MSARILALPEPHPEPCEVCGNKNLVQVAAVRHTGWEWTAAGPARIRPCPLLSGADLLHAIADLNQFGGPTGGAA